MKQGAEQSIPAGTLVSSSQLSWHNSGLGYDAKLRLGGHTVLILHLYNPHSSFPAEWSWAIFPGDHAQALMCGNERLSFDEARQTAADAAVRLTEQLARDAARLVALVKSEAGLVSGIKTGSESRE